MTGPSIRVLPDHVANQIAAGEVVERPASVVKELVENAVDAGASRIDVELRDGGKTEIRVSDDGTGMEREDALLALDRHATSKISGAEDLRSVTSFGFRGEALPSIAAVSRFELETATREGETGTRVRVRAGEVESVEEMARRPGTTVTVRGLFHNVPARAKFLRAAGAETRAVSEVLIPLALSTLRIHHRLVSNGRELLDLPRAESVSSRVADIWGADLADAMLELDHGSEPGEDGSGDLRVGGLIERPESARGGGRRRFVFVNGRPIDDGRLVGTVDDAYRTTVAPDVRPSFLLYLSLPPESVDVNVHPTKSEVKFSQRDTVHGAVRQSVRDRLGDLASTAPLGPGSKTASRSGTDDPEGSRAAGPEGTAEGGASAVRERPPAEPDGGEPFAQPDGHEETVDPEEVPSSASQLAFFVPGHRERRGDTGEEPAEAVGGAAVPRPELWQLHDSYVLAASREGVLIIDQHAAHERVLYETFMERFQGEASGVSQRLLFPLTLRLAPGEYSVVEELANLFREVGFEVEPFGDRTVIVHASPNPHPYFDAERCFREMLRELAEGSPLVNSARNQHEKIAKSLACKGAIKAGQRLSQREMSELVDRLFATELPGHDVHGRPTIVRLSLDELARRFGRT